jgi:hypothetical protein
VTYKWLRSVISNDYDIRYEIFELGLNQLFIITARGSAMMGSQLAQLRFARKKISIIPRTLRDLVMVRLMKQDRLRTVDFAMTYKCNSRCHMCSAKDLMVLAGRRASFSMLPARAINRAPTTGPINPRRLGAASRIESSRYSSSWFLSFWRSTYC